MSWKSWKGQIGSSSAADGDPITRELRMPLGATASRSLADRNPPIGGFFALRAPVATASSSATSQQPQYLPEPPYPQELNTVFEDTAVEAPQIPTEQSPPNFVQFLQQTWPAPAADERESPRSEPHTGTYRRLFHSAGNPAVVKPPMSHVAGNPNKAEVVNQPVDDSQMSFYEKALREKKKNYVACVG